jgi:hypothetical protein
LLGIAVSTLAVWPIFTAYRVGTDLNSRWIYHTWEFRGVEGYRHGDCRITTHPAPFWSRYWRALGLPWPGTFSCAGRCDEFNRSRQIVATVAGPIPPSKVTVVRDERLELLPPYDALVNEHERVIQMRIGLRD